jgi:(2Fe-2S) ferredoxin
MRSADLKYKKLVLVCTNDRKTGKECCAQKLSLELYHKLKTAIAGADPEVRVSCTGCLGNCLSGASVVIMPDDIWLGRVVEGDIEEIVKLVTSNN